MIKKILSTIFAFVIGATQAFAQNVPAQALQPSPSDLVYVIDNFSPALNGHASPYSMSMGQATDVYNARFNDEYGAISKRPALSNYSNCNHSAPVTGLYRFYQSNGNSYTVTSASTAATNYLDYAPDGVGSCINIFSSTTSVGQRWNFATYKDVLIATDGVDSPQKWDGVYQTTANTSGSRSAGYLTAQLGAPFASLYTGSGLTASKWYHYVVAYWDGTNYWYSTAQSNPIQTGTTVDQISLTGIPIGPATTQARYIFRTKADNTAALSQADTTYYYLTTIKDNITQVYTDSTADASLGGTAGAVLSATINNAGSGYTAADTLTLSQTGGSSGTITVNSIYSTGGSTGTITSTSIATPGSGYSGASNVQVTGGTGTGATFNITVNPTNWATITSNNSSAAGGLNVTPPHGLLPYITAGGSGSGYLWLANDPSGTQYGQSTAYFSAPGDIDYFLSPSYFLIRPDDGDSITFIGSYLGTITVGKTNTWSKIYTSASSSSSWTVSPTFSNIGCIAPYSAVSTPSGVIYLGRFGLYEFNGQTSQLISDVISNDALDINQANLNNIVGVFWKNEYRIAYPSVQAGAVSNNRVMIYDMIRNDYVKDTENINAWAVFNSNGDFGGLYSGSSGTDGNILVHSQQPRQLIIKYLSDFNAGTFSNSGAFGTQSTPLISLSSSAWSADSSSWASSTGTWQADAQPGTWTSQIYQINASTLSLLSWNTSMPSGTSDTIAIRTASTSAGISGAAWSSEFSSPGGSNVSGVTANNYIQLRITFNTSNLGITPSIYVQNNYAIKLTYSPSLSTYETTVPTSWTSGWIDLVTSPYLFYMSNFPKSIKEVDIYYEGTQGLLNVTLQNLKGDSSSTFTVDMSQKAGTTPYFGPGTSESVGSPGNYTVYVWKAPLNGIGGLSGLYGDHWLLNLTESGTTAWRVERIAIRFDLEPFKSYT